MFLSKVDGLIMVPECSVGISKTPARSALPYPASDNRPQIYAHLARMWDMKETSAGHPLPVIEVLCYDEVFEVVVYGSLIVLEQRVGVSQAVAGLGFHSSILQLPRQLQCPPETHIHDLDFFYCQFSFDTVRPFKIVIVRRTYSAPPRLQTPPERCRHFPDCSTLVSLLHGRQIPWLWAGAARWNGQKIMSTRCKDALIYIWGVGERLYLLVRSYGFAKVSK